MPRKPTGKVINCKICGKERYVPECLLKKGARYCSIKCFKKDNPPWNKGKTKEYDKRLQIISNKSRKQMYEEYANGTRDRFNITQKANETVRIQGFPSRKGKPTWNKGKTKEDTPSLRKLSEARKGEGNPRYRKKPWNKMYPTKKWWEETEFIKLRKKCLQRDNHQCVKCKVSDKEKELYCDHIVPYRICKEHKIDNLQMLCGNCHSIKTAQDTKIFFRPD